MRRSLRARRPCRCHCAATGDDDHLVGQTLGLGQLVGGEQDARTAIACRARDDGADREPPLGVHPGRGLVQEHDLRPAHERQCHGQPLVLSSGKPSRRCPRELAQPDELHEPVGILGILVVAGEELEHPACAHRRIYAATLEHDADVRHEGAVLGDRVVAENPHLTPRDLPVALERLDGRGLPGAVRSQQREHLATLGRERELVHRHQPVVPHHQLAAVDRRCRHRGEASGGDTFEPEMIDIRLVRDDPDAVRKAFSRGGWTAPR